MYKRQEAKCYDDDGHSQVIGLRLLQLAAVIISVEKLSPQTDIRQNDNETIVQVRGEKSRNSASCTSPKQLRMHVPCCEYIFRNISFHIVWVSSALFPLAIDFALQL